MNAYERNRELLAIAKVAEAESDAQVRNLLDVLDRACDPESGVSATDAAKLVNAALALNTCLKQRVKDLSPAVRREDFRREFAAAAAAATQ